MIKKQCISSGLLFWLVFLLGSVTSSVRCMNLLLRPSFRYDTTAVIAAYVEKSFGDAIFNANGVRVNALQLWNPDQRALKMLEGFSQETAIGKKRIQVDAPDDGVRGHFDVSGNFALKAAGALAARYYFAHGWAVGAYLPFFSLQLKNVQWCDRTQNVTDEDLRVKQFLTNNLFERVKELSGGLELGGWTRTGAGDLTILLEWFRDFPQYKPLLKSVGVNWRMGVVLPTGMRQDEDKIIAIPFGNDGAFAVPFGAGLDVTLGCYIHAGLDVQLMHTFGNTRERRIKTDLEQTDLLFLRKAHVYKDYGLSQLFSLYGQANRIAKGFSFLMAYQFFKRGDDEISLCSNDFSTNIANTAESLKERTLHQILLRADYDMSCHLSDDAVVKPEVRLYARLPFNGKRSIQLSTIGFSVELNF